MNCKSKIIVMARNSDGDDTFVSFETKECRVFRKEDKKKIDDQIRQKILPIEDTILYTVRINENGKKDNWKCKDLNKLNKVLEDIFNRG